MFAVALAVGLTPELLPMIVTVTLARSAMQMAKRKVIVKRLSAIHDVGAMNVLCTDKTGTLTEAKIKLCARSTATARKARTPFSYAYVNSKFETGIKSPSTKLSWPPIPFDMSGFKKIDEAPFDFERRRVSVLVEHDGKRGLFVKGRSGGHPAAVEAISRRRRSGEAASRRDAVRPFKRRSTTRRARFRRTGHRQPTALAPRPPTRKPRPSPMKPIWFLPASRSFWIPEGQRRRDDPEPGKGRRHREGGDRRQ